ncbi:SPZ5 (predicted) [Pycnogonum litorale]
MTIYRNIFISGALWVICLCSSLSYNYHSKYDKPFLPPGGSLVHRYSSRSYYVSDYRKPKNEFKPGPLYCPENGKTVCDNVDKYPSDLIYGIVSHIKTSNFNMSSLFSDERNGDQNPHIKYDPRPPQDDGYVIYQHSIRYDYNVPPPLHHEYYLDHPRPWTEQQTYQYSHYRRQSKSHLRDDDNDNHDDDDDSKQKSTRRHRGDGAFRHRRRGRSQDVETPCRSRSKFISPKAAMNENSEWKYVVNVAGRNPNYKQVIKVDICESPGDICSEDISLPFGFRQSCRQKYIKKRMLALDESGNGVSEENFFIPSCCICEISRDVDGDEQSLRRRKRDGGGVEKFQSKTTEKSDKTSTRR